MSGSWGRMPRGGIGRDLQALAIWVLIIGVIAYLLFPGFFKDVYARLSPDATQTTDMNNINLPISSFNNADTNTMDNSSVFQNFPGVDSNLYSGQNDVASGYWVIFVASGEFKQLAVSAEAYSFLQHVIQSDKNGAGKNTVILASNGQIHKYLVADEEYSIITDLALIDARTGGK